MTLSVAARQTPSRLRGRAPTLVLESGSSFGKGCHITSQDSRRSRLTEQVGARLERTRVRKRGQCRACAARLQRPQLEAQLHRRRRAPRPHAHAAPEARVTFRVLLKPTAGPGIAGYVSSSKATGSDGTKNSNK